MSSKLTNIATCPSCGVLVDFEACKKLHGSYKTWCHDEIEITMCPVCKKELPDDSESHLSLDYFNYHRAKEDA